MKKIFLLIMILPLLAHSQQAYTVSNVAGMTANFRTLQGAIDSVAAGSTLYLFPSTVDYGNVNINKKLFIIGTGYMLDQNTTPFMAPTATGVMISSIYFMPGSSDSYIQGVAMNGVTTGVRYYRFFLDSVSNITINRCLVEIWGAFPNGNYLFITKNTNNCTISQCYITETNLEFFNHSGGETFIEEGTGSQNLQFNNNLFDNRGNGPGFTFNHNVNPTNYGNIIFNHNTFQGDLGSSSFCNYTFFNNFFVSNANNSGISSSLGLNGVTSSNISNRSGIFPANSFNLLVPNLDGVFQYSAFGYHSFEQKWQVYDTSFAKHAANDGGEVGSFGGANPYVFSGIPPLPEIYNLSAVPDPKNRGRVLVHLKAKASY
ncbi:MAG: hypothetical protein ABJB86_04695 [Bacteroidota bacterium]